VRFFPNRQGVTYIGRIHELVEHSIYRLPHLTVVKSPVRIHHYGHTEEVRKAKDKAKLYTPLGETKIKDVPRHWQAYFELGVEHNCNGKHAQSVAAFLKGIDLNPDYVPAWVNLGYVYCEMGEYKKAVLALSTALDLDPRSDEAYCNLSVVYLRLPNHPVAEKYARMAVSLNPNYVNAFCNLGKALAYQNRHAEAALIFQRALELLPQCTSAKMDLGALHLAARNFSTAEKYFREVLSDNPGMTDAYYNLGLVYKNTHRAADAVRALERFCELAGPVESSTDARRTQILQSVQRECQELKALL
jgi:tetratricopeptide (TPR) repeat protein